MPANLPDLSALTMYGPVATRYCEPYVVGLFLSSGPANSCGTGAEIGSWSAGIRVAAPGLFMWNTIVNLLGVVIPAIGAPEYFALSAPTSGAGVAEPK